LDVIESLLPRRGIDLHTDWIRISKAGHALTALFVVVSLLSCFFIVGKYRTATPVQRRQIVVGGFGAAALAIAMGTLIYFR
jgi:hypothetical protein